MGYTLYFAVGLLHLQDLGHAKSVGAWALSIFGISTLLGKLALGALGDRYDPRYVWAATAAAFGVGLIVMSTATSDARLFSCIVLLGFGFGGGLASMFAVLSNYFGPKAFPSVAGLAVALTTCAGALAPPLAGLLYTQSGSYRSAFLMIAAWCFAGAVLMAVTRRPLQPDIARADVCRCVPATWSSMSHARRFACTTTAVLKSCASTKCPCPRPAAAAGASSRPRDWRQSFRLEVREGRMRGRIESSFRSRRATTWLARSTASPRGR